MFAPCFDPSVGMAAWCDRGVRQGLMVSLTSVLCYAGALGLGHAMLARRP